MGQIKPENIHGIVTNEGRDQRRYDRGSMTVVTNDKRRIPVDKDTGNSILKRIDKDKARAERIKGG